MKIGRLARKCIPNQTTAKFRLSEILWDSFIRSKSSQNFLFYFSFEVLRMDPSVRKEHKTIMKDVGKYASLFIVKSNKVKNGI